MSVSRPRLLHDVLAEPPARSGALVQGARRLTVPALDEASTRLARFLRRRSARWAAPLVGVSSVVTIDSVIAIFGALKAGLAYVPLDVRSPPDRLSRVIDDARLAALLVDPAALPALGELPRVETLVTLGGAPPPVGATPLEAAVAEQGRAPEPAGPPRVLIDDLAYVLYTSGSTGTPKGVVLTHRNARTFVDWMQAEFRLTPEDRVMSRSPLNFDLSVFDVFTTLLAGATVVIHDQLAHQHLESTARHRAYVDDMRRHGATVLYTTPSTFTTLLDKGGLDARVPLRLMLYAGEPFRPPLLRALMQALPRTRVANIYGPTETNIVTCHWVERPPEGDEPIPIGVEVDDTEIRVVRDDGAECAPGEVGELWVRGGTVCLGYWGRPDLTRERLVQSPFHRFPATFWRTGDYGFRRPDGVLVYHGRLDAMVKVRGYRIELGDVESALASAPGVSLAVAVPLPHPHHGSTLTALVVPREGAALSVEALRAHAAARLPAYMVPERFEVRGELPSTSTGKVDRQRLVVELSATARSDA